MASPEKIYREAEALESRFLFKPAIKRYQEVVKSKDRRWARRAAYRIVTLVRNTHFSSGRSETVRRRVVSLYKSLQADFPAPKQDPELWAELGKEIRWTRLGLCGPDLIF